MVYRQQKNFFDSLEGNTSLAHLINKINQSINQSMIKFCKFYLTGEADWQEPETESV
jgi:hypothetical protein